MRNWRAQSRRENKDWRWCGRDSDGRSSLNSENRVERGTMEYVLTAAEARVLGALVEKQITTPEYYPLSLNALVNACNQKTNREPIAAYDEVTVREAIVGLRDRGLARPARGADSRVTKYEQRLQEVFHFKRAE